MLTRSKQERDVREHESSRNADRNLRRASGGSHLVALLQVEEPRPGQLKVPR